MDKMLVPRADGVRAICCDDCYPGGLIENHDPGATPCQTEAYPLAWESIPRCRPCCPFGDVLTSSTQHDRVTRG